MSAFGCPEPRLVVFVYRPGETNHIFKKYSRVSVNIGEWHECYDPVVEYVESYVFEHYGMRIRCYGMLFNCYRDGNDSIGMHEDKDARNNIVPSISLGSSRTFIIQKAFHRHQEDKDLRKKRRRQSKTSWRQVTKIELTHGSILLMQPGMNGEKKIQTWN